MSRKQQSRPILAVSFCVNRRPTVHLVPDNFKIKNNICLNPILQLV